MTGTITLQSQDEPLYVVNPVMYLCNEPGAVSTDTFLVIEPNSEAYKSFYYKWDYDPESI